MDKEVKQLVANLNSTSATTVFKALSEVRKVSKLEGGPQAFLTSGGPTSVIALLRNPSWKIVDLSLSVLGNCLLHEPTRAEVRHHSGLPEVLNVAKRHDRESLRCRACRCIGNLASDDESAAWFHQNGGLKVVLKILNEATQDETKQMAIRALRIIVKTDKQRKELVEMKGISSIAKHLPVKNTETVKSAVKALSLLSLKSDEHCALQFQGEGKGYEELVKLVSSPDASIKTAALVCITNLSAEPTARPPLGNAGAIIAIIEVVQNTSGNPDLPSLITSLCLFCREAVNRVKIREGGGLQILLNVLRNPEKMHLHERVAGCLLNFLYDEQSLKVCIDDGLVPILVVLLRNCVWGRNASHCGISQTVKNQKVVPVRRSATNSRDWSPVSPPSGCFSPDHRPFLWRDVYSPPLSPQSFGSLSPRWSPHGHSSPVSTSSAPVDFDEDCYSPVMFDDDDEDDLEEETNSREDVVELEEKADDVNPDDNSDCSADRTYVDVILMLFSRLSHMEEPPSDLMSRECVLSLLHYLCVTHNASPRVGRILTRLARNIRCLRPLVCQQYILQVQRELCEPKHANCEDCNWLSKLGKTVLTNMSVSAQTDFGVGELAHCLQMGSDANKLHVAVSIPFLIRANKLLNSLLIERGGLAILLNVLRSNTNSETRRDVIRSMSMFAEVIGIDVLKPGKFSLNGICKYEASEHKCDVTFVLDDSSQVSACRYVLASSSSVFGAMLSGSFRESSQMEVPLHEVTHSGLVCVIHHLYGCCCPVMSIVDVNSVLELLILSDKYLLQDLQELACKQMLGRFFNSENVYIIYESMLSNFGDICRTLRAQVVKYLLVGKLTVDQKVQCFQKFCSSQHQNDFINDLDQVLRDTLDNRLKSMSNSASIL